MLRKLIYKLLERRHFWREATFGEVAEIYISRTLRVAAVHVGAGFTSVYLYKYGYSLKFIMAFWAIFYLVRAIITPILGLMVSKLGTARGTLLSNLLYIPAMVILGFVPSLGLKAIVPFAILMGLSGAIYELCYFVEFSRVKNLLHAGKEIGFMNFLEKITAALSPLMGGVIALFFGPQFSMWFAGILFVFSSIPLFKISSQAERQQRFVVRGFPWHITMPNMVARAAEGFDAITSSVVWGLFIAIIIFPHVGNDIYVIIGALSSITVLVAILASFLYGKIIDKNQGGNLLRAGVTVNAMTHLSRIFVTTPFDVVGVNMVNEAATTAQTMAFMRGMFDMADVSGHRVMYLTGIEMAGSFGAAFASWIMVLCIDAFTSGIDFKVFFFVTSIVVSLIATAHFFLYRRH